MYDAREDGQAPPKAGAGGCKTGRIPHILLCDRKREYPLCEFERAVSLGILVRPVMKNEELSDNRADQASAHINVS
jgi:hypothetical protein